MAETHLLENYLAIVKVQGCKEMGISVLFGGCCPCLGYSVEGWIELPGHDDNIEYLHT